MNCPNQIDNTELLLAYAANQLDAESAKTLEEHLQQCEHCRELVAAQTAVWRALDGWEAPAVSPDFDRRLYSRARELRLSWWERMMRPLRLPLRQVLPLAAAACLLVLAGLIMERPAVIHPVPSGEPVRVEQVERTLDDLELLNQFNPPSHTEKAHSDTL